MPLFQTIRDDLEALAPELQALADDMAQANTDTPMAVRRLTDLVDELLAFDECAPLLEAASDVALQLLARWVTWRVGAIWAEALDDVARQARLEQRPGWLAPELQAERLAARTARLRQHAGRTAPLLRGPGRVLRGRAPRVGPVGPLP